MPALFCLTSSSSIVRFPFDTSPRTKKGYMGYRFATPAFPGPGRHRSPFASMTCTRVVPVMQRPVQRGWLR
jgi:hypothetical protein